MLAFGIIPVLLLNFCHAAPRSSQFISNSCRCVPAEQCPSNSVSKDESSYSAPGDDSACQNFGEICCAPVSKNLRDKESITKSFPILNERTTNLEQPRSTFGNVLTRKCGLRNFGGLDPNDRAERKDESKFGEFPWMVALLAKSAPNEEGLVSMLFRGGGSLIHPKVVLTAAHCVHRYAPRDLIIRAGEWDPRNQLEPLAHKHRRVEKIIMHENYRHAAPYANDYAIIILKKPFVLAKHIGVVCLPDRLNEYETVNCTATGWGKKVSSDQGNEMKILKKVELPLISNRECAKKYNSGVYRSDVLHESFLCAGGEYGKDTCSYDSGGPLVCPIADDPTRYVQVGIVAAGPQICGTAGIPGQYSDTQYARRWILQNLADNGIRLDDF